MRRVLMVAPAFPPQGGVGAQRPAKFARYLPEFGWAPVVLSTPVPPEGPQDPLLAAEVASVPVHRPPASRLPGISDTSLRWLPAAWKRMQHLARQTPIDAVYITGGPFFPFALPWHWHRAGGPPYVLDFRDPWTTNPYTRSTTWKGRLLLPVFQWLERQTVSGADAVVAVSRVMAEEMAAAHAQQQRDKFVTIYNGYDPGDFAGLTPFPMEPDTWNLVYLGTAALPHYPFDGILAGIEELLLQAPHMAKRFRLHLVGNVSPSYVQLVRSAGLKDAVRVHGFLPHREALRVLVAGDAALLVIESPAGPERVRYDVSGKLFQYLRAGKPVLARIPEGGEAHAILQAARLLVPVGPTPSEVARAILECERRFVDRVPNQEFIQQFDRRRQAEQLARVLDRCVRSSADKHSARTSSK